MPEAGTMDPQQRKLLELGYAALHGAGLRRAELGGGRADEPDPAELRRFLVACGGVEPKATQVCAIKRGRTELFVVARPILPSGVRS